MDHSSHYLKSSKILNLGEIIEFQIEAVNADEAENVQDVEYQPCQKHEYVVNKDHVVDHGRVNPRDDPPRGEDAHHPEPACLKEKKTSIRSIPGSAAAIDQHLHVQQDRY